MTIDNSDVHAFVDGRITDMRIEHLFKAFLTMEWAEPDLDTLFTEVLAEFLEVELPSIRVSVVGPRADNCNALFVLSLLGFDFRVVYAGSFNWPGLFTYMPKATCAITLYHDCVQGGSTSYAPGTSLNQAALLALVQLAREISDIANNQGNLSLN